MAGMKRIAAVLLVILLSMSTVRAGGPEALPRPAIPWWPEQMVCRRVTTPITIDGIIGEEEWKGTMSTGAFVDITGDATRLPHLDTNAIMAWDDDCLYIAARMVEQNVWATLSERDAVIFHDNDFEVFIDPDGDTHQYYEIEVNALNTVWDLLLVRPYRDGGPAVNAWDIKGLETAVKVQWTINDPSDLDSQWTVEMAIPWTSLGECTDAPVPPRDGDAWRVNFSRVEWQTEIVDGKTVKRTDPDTGKPLSEYNWVWSPQGLVNMHYPEMWGVVVFRIGGDAVGITRPLGSRMQWALRLVYYAERDYFNAHGHYTDNLPALGVELPAEAGADCPWPPQLTASASQWTATLRAEIVSVSIDHEGRARVDSR
jgi:hypothetical protein